MNRSYVSISQGSSPKKSRTQSRLEPRDNIQVKEKDAFDDVEQQKQQILQEILNKEPTEDQDTEQKPEHADDEEEAAQQDDEKDVKDDNVNAELPERPKSAASWNSRSSKMQYIKRLEELLKQEKAKNAQARKKTRGILSKH